MSVLTALTAQNTTGVQGIHAVPADFVRQQLSVVRSDVRVDAIKIGMLADADIVNALAAELSQGQAPSGELSTVALPPLLFSNFYLMYTPLGLPIVLDPVMVSTSGSLLLSHTAIRDLVDKLLPLCTILTPNLPEAKELLAHSRKAEGAGLNNVADGEAEDQLATLRSLLAAAKQLCSLGPASTLVKGGHQVMSRATVDAALEELGITLLDEDQAGQEILGAEVMNGILQQNAGEKVVVIRTDGQPWADVLRLWSQDDGVIDPDVTNVVVDVLYETQSRKYTLFVKPHIEATSTHGTGCTLSSAIATYLAGGDDVATATHRAIQYVQSAIARGLSDLGKGPGPLNHLAGTTLRPILAPSPVGSQRAPLCGRLIAHSLPHWRRFTRHPFVTKLVEGTLPREAFVWFLRQDYLFLRHYARVWASGASSSSVGRTFERIATFAGIASEMASEAESHVAICKRWGITRDDLESKTRESAATLAYTRFVLDTSRSGDALELLAATGPCLLGYGEAGVWLGREWSRRKAEIKDMDEETKAYGEWIDYYSSKDFLDVVRKGIEDMENYASSDPPSQARLANLQRIWNAAVRLEIGMWDEALDKTLRREIVDP
ncbi:hypothetical protein L7F22_007835 [Adiantum nelumboides]|nr:hypothetical protein [Adiantum nelumboides]